MPAISLDGVAKRYGDVVALDGIDLTVEPGRFHCLVGPNGSGKTTLFRLLLGLTRPTDGTVSRPDGALGCSFQTPTFYPGLTVAENLDVFARMTPPPGPAWRERLEAVLRLDDVADRRAGALSGGWQKKLDLALAFLGRPPLVVLDEPLDDLDDVATRRLCDFLAAYPDEDRGVLVATHHVHAFEGYVDRLTVLDRGAVVYDGPVEDGASARERYLDLVTE